MDTLRWLSAFALVTLAQGALTAVSSARAPSAAAVTAAFFVGYLLGALHGARIAAAGVRRLFNAGAVLVALVAVLLAATPPQTWPVWRLVNGYGYALALVALEQFVLRSERRERALAGYMLSFYLAAGAGQLALAGAEPPLLACAVVALLGAVLPTRVQVERAEGPRGRLGAAALPGVLAAAGSGLVYGAVYAHAPGWLAGSGGAGLAAAGMATFVASGALLQSASGRLAERIGPRATQAAVGVALPLALIAWIHTLSPLAAALGGALAALIYPLGMATLAATLRPEQRPAASGAMLCACALGSAAGPWAAPRMELLPLLALGVALGVAVSAAALRRPAFPTRARDAS